MSRWAERRRRRAVLTNPFMVPHTGIRLRISNMNGTLLEADSDHLYHSAVYGLITGHSNECGPMCQPGCTTHGWYEIIPGLEMPYTYDPAEPRQCHLRIEIKPVHLTELPTDSAERM